MLTRLKYWLVNRLSEHLLPVVRIEDIISFNARGQLFIGSELASPQLLKNLKEEVRFLESGSLMKYMMTYVENVARKILFEKSQDYTDMVIAKVMLYNLSVQRQFLKKVLEAKYIQAPKAPNIVPRASQAPAEEPPAAS